MSNFYVTHSTSGFSGVWIHIRQLADVHNYVDIYVGIIKLLFLDPYDYLLRYYYYFNLGLVEERERLHG